MNNQPAIIIIIPVWNPHERKTREKSYYFTRLIFYLKKTHTHKHTKPLFWSIFSHFVRGFARAIKK